MVHLFFLNNKNKFKTNMYIILLYTLFYFISLSYEFVFLNINYYEDEKNINLINILFDCFYYSIITWTTIGYGSLHQKFTIKNKYLHFTPLKLVNISQMILLLYYMYSITS